MQTSLSRRDASNAGTCDGHENRGREEKVVLGTQHLVPWPHMINMASRCPDTPVTVHSFFASHERVTGGLKIEVIIHRSASQRRHRPIRRVTRQGLGNDGVMERMRRRRKARRVESPGGWRRRATAGRSFPLTQFHPLRRWSALALATFQAWRPPEGSKISPDFQLPLVEVFRESATATKSCYWLQSDFVRPSPNV